MNTLAILLAAILPADGDITSSRKVEQMRVMFPSAGYRITSEMRTNIVTTDNSHGCPFNSSRNGFILPSHIHPFHADCYPFVRATRRSEITIIQEVWTAVFEWPAGVPRKLEHIASDTRTTNHFKLQVDENWIDDPSPPDLIYMGGNPIDINRFISTNFITIITNHL